MSWQKMIVLGAVMLAMGVAGMANAELATEASENFTYKYEMDYMPTDVAHYDLDGNGQPDFDMSVTTVVGDDPTWTASGGFSTMDTGDDDSNNIFLVSNGATNIWPGKTTHANGYTVEFSVQILSHNGVRGSFALAADTPGSTTRSFANLWEGGEIWGINADLAVGTHVNSDDFHVFRIVQQPNSETFSMWRDGELLSDSLPGSDNGGSGGDTFAIGDVGNKWGGVAVFDYLRFTSGAYAPVPETYLPGDANRDGAVNGSDAAILAANWLNAVDVTWTEGDFNEDGIVDDIDATLMAANFVASASAVPEPAALVLLLGAIPIFCLLRKR